MRRLPILLTVLLACLLGLPVTSQATPRLAADPLGGGADLFQPGGGFLQCTASFAAVDAHGEGYLVARPECGRLLSLEVFSLNSAGKDTLVGTVVAAEPGYALVHVTNRVDWELVGWIRSGFGNVAIAGSVETPVGGSVCVVDRTFRADCGAVVAKNDTVGSVSGLTRVSVCASPRAVAYVSGDQAQGVPFGGSTFCPTAGTSWFSPLNPILKEAELTLLTG